MLNKTYKYKTQMQTLSIMFHRLTVTRVEQRPGPFI